MSNSMILVEALETYEKNKIRDKELNRIPKKGEQFKVTEKRFEELLGKNDYQLVFVKKVVEKKETTTKSKK